MPSHNGTIFKRLKYTAIALLLLQTVGANCQKTILDSLLTLNSGYVKTITALEIITKQTGYNFTYDSRLINTEKIIDLTFSSVSLRTILENITSDDSLEFSVIDRYIIFSRKTAGISPKADSLSEIQFDYITGTITDAESKEALAFATVALKNKGKGTVTNTNGEFGLKIGREMVNDTLSVSYIGYINIEIPVSESLGKNLELMMEREFIAIPGIIIRNQIPQEIISKSVRAIPENYSKSPVFLTGFYREGVLKRRFLQNYSEAN